MEIFFRPLNVDEIEKIALNGAGKGGFLLSNEGAREIAKYATNGRDAINIIQISGGIAINENRINISVEDIDWVIESGNYSPRPEKSIESDPQIGYVNGLAVYGPNMGTVIEVEASAIEAEAGMGVVTITGIVEEEETGVYGTKVQKKKHV